MQYYQAPATRPLSSFGAPVRESFSPTHSALVREGFSPTHSVPVREGFSPTHASAPSVPSYPAPVYSSTQLPSFHSTAGNLPAFQAAPPRTLPMSKFPGAPYADYYEDYGPKPALKQKAAGSSVNSVLTNVGAFLLALVALTPIWDCSLLLSSSTYIYFLGRTEPFQIITFCCGIVLFFAIAMLTMECCGRRQARVETSFMYLFTSVITAMGLGLLLFALPLQVNTGTVYNELMTNCNTGPSTQPLYASYNELLSMRLKPDCINRTSVEQCPGFKESYPYTGFLKQLELQSLCSGFCYTPTKQSLAISANTTQPRDAVLLQAPGADDATNIADNLQRRTAKRSGSKRREDTQGVFLMAGDQILSKTSVPDWDELPQGVGDTVNNMVATGWMDAYPPTLFTNANYKTTCEGAAARELRFTAMETGKLMYMEGAVLLVASVLAGFMKILSMCDRSSGEVDNFDGESQYQDYPKTIVL